MTKRTPTPKNAGKTATASKTKAANTNKKVAATEPVRPTKSAAPLSKKAIELIEQLVTSEITMVEAKSHDVLPRIARKTVQDLRRAYPDDYPLNRLEKSIGKKLTDKQYDAYVDRAVAIFMTNAGANKFVEDSKAQVAFDRLLDKLNPQADAA